MKDLDYWKNASEEELNNLSLYDIKSILHCYYESIKDTKDIGTLRIVSAVIDTLDDMIEKDKETMRDKNCKYYEICDETHGKNGCLGYIKCPGHVTCIHPYKSFSDNTEDTT